MTSCFMCVCGLNISAKTAPPPIPPPAPPSAPPPIPPSAQPPAPPQSAPPPYGAAVGFLFCKLSPSLKSTF